MEETGHEAFSVEPSGCVGQTILDPDGRTIAWMTDDWTAQVICRLLNQNQELLLRPVASCSVRPERLRG